MFVFLFILFICPVLLVLASCYLHFTNHFELDLQSACPTRGVSKPQPSSRSRHLAGTVPHHQVQATLQSAVSIVALSTQQQQQQQQQQRASDAALHLNHDQNRLSTNGHVPHHLMVPDSPNTPNGGGGESVDMDVLSLPDASARDRKTQPHHRQYSSQISLQSVSIMSRSAMPFRKRKRKCSYRECKRCIRRLNILSAKDREWNFFPFFFLLYACVVVLFTILVFIKYHRFTFAMTNGACTAAAPLPHTHALFAAFHVSRGSDWLLVYCSVMLSVWESLFNFYRYYSTKKCAVLQKASSREIFSRFLIYFVSYAMLYVVQLHILWHIFAVVILCHAMFNIYCVTQFGSILRRQYSYFAESDRIAVDTTEDNMMASVQIMGRLSLLACLLSTLLLSLLTVCYHIHIIVYLPVIHCCSACVLSLLFIRNRLSLSHSLIAMKRWPQKCVACFRLSSAGDRNSVNSHHHHDTDDDKKKKKKTNIVLTVIDTDHHHHHHNLHHLNDHHGIQVSNTMDLITPLNTLSIDQDDDIDESRSYRGDGVVEEEHVTREIKINADNDDQDDVDIDDDDNCDADDDDDDDEQQQPATQKTTDLTKLKLDQLRLSGNVNKLYATHRSKSKYRAHLRHHSDEEVQNSKTNSNKSLHKSSPPSLKMYRSLNVALPSQLMSLPKTSSDSPPSPWSLTLAAAATASAANNHTRSKTTTLSIDFPVNGGSRSEPTSPAMNAAAAPADAKRTLSGSSSRSNHLKQHQPISKTPQIRSRKHNKTYGDGGCDGEQLLGHYHHHRKHQTPKSWMKTLSLNIGLVKRTDLAMNSSTNDEHERKQFAVHVPPRQHVRQPSYTPAGTGNKQRKKRWKSEQIQWSAIATRSTSFDDLQQAHQHQRALTVHQGMLSPSKLKKKALDLLGISDTGTGSEWQTPAATQQQSDLLDGEFPLIDDTGFVFASDDSDVVEEKQAAIEVDQQEPEPEQLPYTSQQSTEIGTDDEYEDATPSTQTNGNQVWGKYNDTVQATFSLPLALHKSTSDQNVNMHSVKKHKHHALEAQGKRRSSCIDVYDEDIKAAMQLIKDNQEPVIGDDENENNDNEDDDADNEDADDDGDDDEEDKEAEDDAVLDDNRNVPSSSENPQNDEVVSMLQLMVEHGFYSKNSLNSVQLLRNYNRQ